MKYAVFLRNVNLGHPRCPGKAAFEQAFIEAGAGSAASFQTNGTLVYSTDSHAQAQQVLASACLALQRDCGMKEPAFVRTLDYLSAVVALDPFAGIDRRDLYGCYVSFVHSRDDALPSLPLHSGNGGVELVYVTPAEVLSVSRKVGNAVGNPNHFLETRFGTPFTTRSWTTLQRLVARHG